MDLEMFEAPFPGGFFPGYESSVFDVVCCSCLEPSRVVRIRVGKFIYGYLGLRKVGEEEYRVVYLALLRTGENWRRLILDNLLRVSPDVGHELTEGDGWLPRELARRFPQTA